MSSYTDARLKNIKLNMLIHLRLVVYLMAVGQQLVRPVFAQMPNVSCLCIIIIIIIIMSLTPVSSSNIYMMFEVTNVNDDDDDDVDSRTADFADHQSDNPY